ncbi:hypothetical protein GCM10027188_29620 [Lysobacter humi (ex Lee et al. 2017)]
MLYAVFIILAANMLGFVSGLAFARWELFGATIEEAVENSRLLRRVAIGAVAAFFYWRLAAPVTSRKWLHVVVAFLAVQVLDILLSVVLFSAPLHELVDPGPTIRGALAALVGWGLAALGANNSSKPTPLRGAA